MNLNTNGSAALLVATCDKYCDLWDDFFYLKEMNWNDCRYICYLVTESIECMNNSVITIKCGLNTEWSTRIRIALHQIDQKYVILLLDDFYISNKVDSYRIDEAISLMERNSIKYYKLNERYKINGEHYQGEKYLTVIKSHLRYGVSLLAAIWDKEYLLQVLGEENISAWEFELKRNMVDDITKKNPKLWLYDKRDILHITHMVQRGKYLSLSVKKLKRKGFLLKANKRDYIGVLGCLLTNIGEKIRGNELLRKMVIVVIHIFNKKTISEKYEEWYKAKARN